MESILWFALDGWWMALCLWLAIRIAEGSDEGNPPLLALAIGFGFAAGATLFGSLGLALSLVLFFILITVYRLSMPAALLTCVLLAVIQFAFSTALVALATKAGPGAAIALLVVLVALSLRWWWHDLSLFGTWMRQRSENAYPKAKTDRPASPRKAQVPKAQIRPSSKPVATELKQSPAPPERENLPSPASLPDKPTLLD